MKSRRQPPQTSGDNSMTATLAAVPAAAQMNSKEVASGFETILVERRERVGLITLNRPKQLNALNAQLAGEVLAALRAFDSDDNIGAIVITGSVRAFAAGADIAEMADKSFADLQEHDLFADWDAV